MDPDLDDRLASAAPATSDRTPQLHRLLRALAGDAEWAARPGRSSHRVGLVAAATAAVLGVGVVGAAAAGVGPGWVPWSTDSGQSCEMRFGVTAADAAGPSDAADPHTLTESERAVQAATAFLADFDYTSINQDQAVARWQKIEDRTLSQLSASPELAGPTESAESADASAFPDLPPRLTGDDLELTAVGAQVWTQLATYLKAEQIPTDLVVFSQGWRCDD